MKKKQLNITRYQNYLVLFHVIDTKYPSVFRERYFIGKTMKLIFRSFIYNAGNGAKVDRWFGNFGKSEIFKILPNSRNC